MLIDPDFSGDELRSKIYGGDLVILTRLQALADLASFNREVPNSSDTFDGGQAVRRAATRRDASVRQPIGEGLTGSP